MKLTQTRGYSASNASKVLNGNPIQYVGPEMEIKYIWKNNRPTSQIDGYSTWFIQEGLPPFSVKFPEKVKLPDYLQKVEFEGLEACEVRNNVYFRAKGLKVVK